MAKRETFVRKGTNAAALAAGAVTAIAYIGEAERNSNLPHNTLTLSNLSDDCELFVFLDDASDLDTPDYVLYPNSQMSIKEEEGVTYNTVFIKNTDAVIALGINELKHRFSTVKEAL
jgi:hypothetical protein